MGELFHSSGGQTNSDHSSWFESSVNRREFVKASVATGAMIATAGWSADQKSGEMIYRTLGRTGEKHCDKCGQCFSRQLRVIFGVATRRQDAKAHPRVARRAAKDATQGTGQCGQRRLHSRLCIWGNDLDINDRHVRPNV